ncbi:Shprh [Symbiodinium sp. CCMP2456]|nr:Shprh [Symbiodinium sp. CCMP2456]
MEAITGPGPGKAISASSQAGSDLNTSAGGTSRQSANVERRIAWLEEDVAVLHRRVKAECSDLGGGAAGDSGLRALVARLDGELAQERRMRELLEARMVTVEENLNAERKDREASINTLASELDKTMKGLIGRIDEGLSQGAAAMRERTDQTKVRLHSLIKRVDEGLTAGAAALQDSLNTNTKDVLSEHSRTSIPSRSGGCRGSVSPTTKQQLQQNQAYPQKQNPQQQLEQQQLQMQQHQQQQAAPRTLQIRPGMDQRLGNTMSRRSPQTSQAPSVHRSPAQTPSSAFPGSMQVPGSGLGAGYSQVQGGPGMTLGGYPRAQVQTVPAGARSPQQVMRVLRN